MPAIPWYTGLPEEFEAARVRRQGTLDAIRRLSGGAAGAYGYIARNLEQNKQERAAYRRAYESQPDQYRAAQFDAASTIPPEVADEENLPENAKAGPSEAASNLTASQAYGTGAGGTDPDDLTYSQILQQGRQPGANDILPPGPFAGDEPPLMRAIRALGVFARIPGVNPTQPGPSTVERTASLQGVLDRAKAEREALQAVSPAARQLTDPMAVLRRVGPTVMRNVPPGVGGERWTSTYGRGRTGAPTAEETRNAEIWRLAYYFAINDDPPREEPDEVDFERAAKALYGRGMPEVTETVTEEPDVTGTMGRKTQRTYNRWRPGEAPSSVAPPRHVPGHPDIPLYEEE